jgi:carbonic anhydrase/acetyltransferase-like protein (isoleucine patch superfamily)
MIRGAGQRPNPGGDRPRIAASALLDPTAVVVGNVIVGEEVFVGPGAVIRADEPGSAVVIGDRSNVQDRVVVHALEGSRVVIGSETSLSHACIVHGPCTIGDGCFVGFGSVVFNATLGDRVVVRHLAVVDGVGIAAGRMVGSGTVVDNAERAGLLGSVDGETAGFARRIVAANLSLLEGYRDMA